MCVFSEGQNNFVDPKIIAPQKPFPVYPDTDDEKIKEKNKQTLELLIKEKDTLGKGTLIGAIVGSVFATRMLLGVLGGAALELAIAAGILVESEPELSSNSGKKYPFIDPRTYATTDKKETGDF